MIHVSKRLQTICDFVPEGSRICDVGCDHAFVDIRILQEGKVSSCLAMDVADGPLAKAKENLELVELMDRCELRKSDGLKAYQKGECSVLVCTGMGGILMRDILGQEKEKAASFEELILSPHTEIALVREWLRQNGFGIVEEEFLLDEGKYYTVMRVLPDVGKGRHPDWDEYVGLLSCMERSELEQALINRESVQKLLVDNAFRCFVEDQYGPCVLISFLRQGKEGGRTQQCFLRYVKEQLRSRRSLEENLSKHFDTSENAAKKLKNVRGEMGILQVLLFLYEFLRNKTEEKIS